MQGYKERWVKAHEISKEWVARMTTLVECWNKLDGNVGELSSWVNTKVTAAKYRLSSITPKGRRWRQWQSIYWLVMGRDRCQFDQFKF